MLPGEQVVEDYRHLHLSLKAHPVSFLRAELDARGIVRHELLPDMPSGRRVTVAGLVLVRQRPGTGNGVIFMTLEDETGIANTIVWPRKFERFRPVVLGARLISVTGKLQNEKGVIHIVADAFEDLTPLLRRLSEEGARIDPDAADRRDQAAGAGLMAASAQDAVADRWALADNPDRSRHPRSGDSFVRMAKDKPAVLQQAEVEHAAKVMPKGRNFH